MSDEIDQRRRRLLSTAAVTIAAGQLGLIGAAAAQSGTTSTRGAAMIERGRARGSAR
jgi:hypothetical protein